MVMALTLIPAKVFGPDCLLRAVMIPKFRKNFGMRR
jgi:hypothetical protein